MKIKKSWIIGVIILAFLLCCAGILNVHSKCGACKARWEAMKSKVGG
jgi:F0F1-type ATP synthase assembly protein I